MALTVDRMLQKWRSWARALKQRTYTLYLAARHPLTPWYAKALALFVIGYAFSPIDLIPDPIPVFGYLDDLVLLPAGIWLTMKLIPADVWTECERRAKEEVLTQRPHSWIAASVIILLWLLAFYLVLRALLTSL